MGTKWMLAVLAALVSGSAMAQFDFGGGATSERAAWEEFKLNPKTRVRLDFRNANVDLVLAFFQRTSGVTIVKDPALTGTITITSANQVSLNEAFQILNTSLGLRGFDLRKDGNLMVVRRRQERPQNQAPAFDMSQITQLMQQNQTNLKVYPIKFANASQVARVVNEVFATTQDPMQQLGQLFGGGGFGGGGAQFGGGRFGGGAGQGRPGGGGGFPGFGGGRPGGFGGFGRQGSAVRASSDEFSNSVIVNAPDREQTQVGALIGQLDKQSEEPQQSKVFRLTFAAADELAPVVQNVLVSNAPRGRGGIGNQNVPIEQRFQTALRFGGTQAAFGQVVADTRTNSLVVTATPQNLESIDKVIKELDTEVEVQASTFVFQLDNARADSVAGLLQQAFGTRQGTGGQFGQNRFNQGNQNRANQQQRRPGQTGAGGLGGLGGGRAPQEQEDPNALPVDLQDPQAQSGELMTMVTAQGGGFGQFFGGGQQRRPGQGTTGRDAQGRLVNVRDLTGQVTAIPDPNTNSIIVVTTPENAELIKSILGQLDKIPEQVMIETIITEATLDNSLKLGVEWNYVQQKAFGQTGVTGTANQRFGLQTANPPLEGFRYTLTGGNLTAFINALQTDGRFQVLSTPRIFTSNNTQAQINISQSVPFVLSTREDPNGNLTFNYSFQDVGIVLTVTPRITANGYVTMEVDQTANDLQGFTSFNAPIVNQRQANTTVTVKDGETVILGGIIRQTVNSTVRKVPLLGDIPILGELFKTTDRTKQKTELLVFLTPRVVRDADEARRLREEEQNKLSPTTSRELEKRISPPVSGDPQKKETPPPSGDPAKKDPPKTGDPKGGK